MSEFVDFYRDSKGVIFEAIKQKYAQGSKLPPFIINHRAMTETELKALSPQEFALPEKRLFPICSKAETWKSIAYFNILKKAALSPASAKDRERIRQMLAKAASLWGLNDDEVEELAKNVNLSIPKEASTETVRDAVTQFINVADAFPEPERRDIANTLLKVAESEPLKEEELNILLKHAGAATCVASDVTSILDEIIPQIPYRSPYYKPLVDLRNTTIHMAASDIMDPEDISNLVSTIEEIAQRYHIKTNAADKLRKFSLADAHKAIAEINDIVRLPGGIRAKKSAVAENAKEISIYLSNLHNVEAYTPDEIISTFNKMSPVDILPFRSLIGAC